jgi:TRAP-type transport system small permease protein
VAELPEGGAGDQTDEVAAQLRAEQYGGRLSRVQRRVNSALHLAGGLVMLALLLWTAGDIIGRSFGNPFRGTVELTEIAVVMLVYLGLAHTEDADRHVTVDLLYIRMGRTGKLVLRMFGGVVALAVMGAMTWRLWVYAQSLDAGGYTTGILHVPLFPVAVVTVVGCAAFTLAILTKTVFAARALVGRR